MGFPSQVSFPTSPERDRPRSFLQASTVVVLLLLRDPGLPNTFMKLEIRIKEKSKDAYVTISFYRLRVWSKDHEESLTITEFVRHLH